MILTLFDCETTGLVWNALLPLSMQPEMIEFACMSLDLESGKIVDGYHTLIKPKGKVPADVSKITGITNEMLADSPPLEDVFPTIKAKLEAHPVIGHNVIFDMEIVHFAGERVKSSVSWKKSYCTMEMSMNLRGKRLNLADLFEILVGRRIGDGTHRASFDVQALAEIVLEMHRRGFWSKQ